MVSPMPQAAAVAIFFASWLLLSGYFTPFLLTAGAGSAVAVFLFARRMRVLEKDFPLRFGRLAFSYWPWLAKEIVKSAWGVVRLIVSPRLR